MKGDLVSTKRYWNRTAHALVFTGRFFLLLRKLECSSRVFVVNTLAWKNRIELAAPIFWFVFHPKIANFYLRQFHLHRQ